MLEENNGCEDGPNPPAESQHSTTSTSKLHLLYKSTDTEEKKDDPVSAQDMKQSLQQNQQNFNEVLGLLFTGFAPAATTDAIASSQTAAAAAATPPDQAAAQAQIQKFLSSMKEEDQVRNSQDSNQEIQNVSSDQSVALQGSEQVSNFNLTQQNLQQMYQTILAIQQQMIEDEERMMQLISKRGEIFQAQLGFLEREIKQSISKFENVIKEKSQFAEQFQEKQVKFYELASEALTKDVMGTLIDMTLKQSAAMVVKILQKQKDNAKQVDFKQEFTDLIQQQIMIPFIQTCKQFEVKIKQVIELGWKHYLQELDAIKREVLMSRSESMNKLSTIEEDLGGQLEEFMLHIDTKIQASIYKGSTIENIMGVDKEDPQVVIQALLEADQVDDAFRQCLTCKDSKILTWMLSKLSPEQTLSTLQLTQPVLIGLVQQICMFLEDSDDWRIFLKWLQEALLLLDENDPELGVYMKKYLEDAYTTLLQCRKNHNLTMQQQKDLMLSTHLMNSKLRYFGLQQNNQ